MQRGRKDVTFFEKKVTKKTFCSLGRGRLNQYGIKESKVFLLLFLQKKKFLLACFCLAAGPAWAQGPVTTVTIGGGGVAISPLLYGVNYSWDQIPVAEYAVYRGAMDDVAHVTLSRYLGGWGAESYDWSANVETGKYAGRAQGEAPAAFLDSVKAASFITPSVAAVKDPAYIGQTARFDAFLVGKYGGRVKYWEIGNEWWLQGGAKKSAARREKNLENYAALVAQAAPAMKAANPGIEVFVMADWVAPDEILRMRQIAGTGWDAVDGISVHSYCGTTDAARRCDALPAGMQAVRQAAGKTLIYASEWAAVRAMNPDDEGARNAALTVSALGEMAAAGVQLAAYWPPVGLVPALNFCATDFRTAYATGIAFGWMSQYYEGTALEASGGALAARQGDEVTVIFPSGDAGPQDVRVKLDGTGLTGVVSAAVLYTDGGKQGEVADLPVTIEQEGGEKFAVFSLDIGGAGRGTAYEIARVTLR